MEMPTGAVWTKILKNAFFTMSRELRRFVCSIFENFPPKISSKISARNFYCYSDEIWYPTTHNTPQKQKVNIFEINGKLRELRRTHTNNKFNEKKTQYLIAFWVLSVVDIKYDVIIITEAQWQWPVENERTLFRAFAGFSSKFMSMLVYTLLLPSFHHLVAGILSAIACD